MIEALVPAVAEKRLAIPELRPLIAKLAEICNSDDLRNAVEQLKRRKPIRRGRPKLRSLTPELLAAIKNYHKANPDANYTDIGRVFHVQIGRVSEALAGYR